jgi:ubiquinone/menaquinone biosynthesis C-methylase UbiE
VAQDTSNDLNNPFFARFYRCNRRTADKRGEREHRRRVVEGLRGRVVEVGAGDGGNFDLYPATVEEVIAIEPERRLRSFAEEAARNASVRVTVMPGLADELPLEDESVDAAVASLVLCTVPDEATALAELRRVLRPGGELRFYEHVHAHSQPTRAILELAYRTRVWPTLAGGCNPTRETGKAIEAAGFVIEECDRFGFSPSVVVPKVPHILGVARRP